MTGGSPDAELVGSARGGDRAAMNELVRRHHGVVFRTVLGILSDEDDAADATQETFIRAFAKLDGFRGEAKFRTWLLSIATNQARGALRRTARRREAPLLEEPRDEGLSGGNDPTERTGLEERVRVFLARLPEKQRLAVTLRLFDGLSFREVGVLIESSEGSARVNYHHGIRRLRGWMEEGT